MKTTTDPINLNPAITGFKHVDARQYFKWGKTSKDESRNILTFNISAEDKGGIKFLPMEFDDLARPEIARCLIAIAPGENISGWGAGNFKPTSILFVDLDGVQEEKDIPNLDPEHWDGRSMVEYGIDELTRVFPNTPKAVIRPSRSGKGVFMAIVTDTVFETREHWCRAIVWLNSKFPKGDNSYNLMRQLLHTEHAYELIEGAPLSIPPIDELPQLHKVVRDKKTGEIKQRSEGGNDHASEEACIRGEAAVRWINKELHKMGSKLTAYPDGKVGGIVRFDYPNQTTRNTYYATPLYSPRVQSYSKLETNADGMSVDAWRRKCDSLNEMDGYFRIEEILDTCHAPFISKKSLEDAEWYANMEFDAEHMEVDADPLVVTFQREKRESARKAEAQRKARGALPSFSSIPDGPATKQFKAQYNDMLPPFSLHVTEGRQAAVAGWWDDFLLQVDEQAVLLYLLTDKIVNGEFWVGNDTLNGKIMGFGFGVDNNQASFAANIELIRMSVLRDFTEMHNHKKRKPKLTTAMVEHAMETLASMNAFNLARLELAYRAKQWNSAKQSKFQQFVTKGLNGDEIHEDDFVAKTLKLFLLYQAVRMWTPNRSGVEFHYALGLRGETRRGKSGLSKLLAGKKSLHTNNPILSTLGDVGRIVEAMQGKAVYEVEEGFNFALKAKDIIATLSNKSYSSRLAYAKTAGSYPHTGIFIITHNKDVKMHNDDALMARLITLCPNGFPIKGSDHITVNFDVLTSLMPELHAECAWLLQGYLTEHYGIPSLETQTEIPDGRWDDEHFSEWAHEQTLSKQEIETGQMSQRAWTRQGKITAVIPEEMFLVYGYGEKTQGALNVYTVTNWLKSITGTTTLANKEDQMSFNYQVLDCIHRFHQNSFENAAKYLLEQHGWRPVVGKTKVKGKKNANVLSDQRFTYALKQLKERVEELGLPEKMMDFDSKEQYFTDYALLKLLQEGEAGRSSDELK